MVWIHLQVPAISESLDVCPHIWFCPSALLGVVTQTFLPIKIFSIILCRLIWTSVDDIQYYLHQAWYGPHTISACHRNSISIMWVAGSSNQTLCVILLLMTASFIQLQKCIESLVSKIKHVNWQHVASSIGIKTWCLHVGHTYMYIGIDLEPPIMTNLINQNIFLGS